MTTLARVGGRKGTIGIVAALVVVGAVVAVIAGGGSDGVKKGRARATTTTTTAKAPPRQRERRPSRAAHPRAGVRHGVGGALDEPAPGTGPLLGIADQKPETFSDPRFRSLGVKRTRLNTPWNSIFTEPARLAAWLDAVRAAGMEPLVAFERARGSACPAQPCSLPTVASYRRAVAAFHARYPWVHLLQPWNEANSSTQPTAHHPERAAAFYEALRGVCPSCQIPAADVLDGSNLVSWLTRFRSALHGREPQLWGLHNYGDINHFRDSGTRRILQLVPGEVWFTEAGGIVCFQTADGRVALPYDEKRAARATQFLFRLASLSPRITRAYVYQWKIDFPGNRFDSGLVRQDGTPRPALRVLLRHRALLR